MGRLDRAEWTPRVLGQDMEEFLAVLAHELRNPLMPIRCALEVINRAKGDAETVARAHAIIERQCAQMVRLLDDLFDVARIASGKVSLRKEQTELNGALRSAVEAVQPLIAAKQHVLELALPLMPVHLDADTVRLTQIVTNLLTNAVKYTPAGGRIRLSACVDSQRGDVQVRVLDTGIGISATELERIFEMFARVDGEDGKRCDGLGVGLALSLDLAMRHGGSITAHSEGPGQGSEFVLTLPVISTPHAECSVSVAQPAPSMNLMRSLSGGALPMLSRYASQLRPSAAETNSHKAPGRALSAGT